ncbi:hypothetical protein ACWCSH_28530, partial [Streptosporangium sp. NPDC001682]
MAGFDVVDRVALIKSAEIKPSSPQQVLERNAVLPMTRADEARFPSFFSQHMAVAPALAVPPAQKVDDLSKHEGYFLLSRPEAPLLALETWDRGERDRALARWNDT